MKKMLMTSILLFMVFFCFGQIIQENSDSAVMATVEEDTIVDDFISLNGRIYFPAAGEGTILYMVSKKDLDRELGLVLERIENHPKDITTTTPIYASFWDVGTKLYKIKQVDDNNYIAVEWPDNVSGNKYYVYCCKKNHSDEKTLKKLYKILNKE